MALLSILQVRLGLDIAAFTQKFNTFTKDLEKRANRFSKGLSGLTNFGSLAGAGGLGAAFTKGITAASRFETTINQVAAASDQGKESVGGLSKIALDFSKGTVFSANEAAEAMLALAKAGITPADQAAGTLAATMQLAATEGMNLGRAAEVMAEQMGAFKLSAADGASIADALAGAANASTSSVEGMAQSFSQLGAVAYQKGQNIEDAAAALALLADSGVKGSDAGTSLRTMLSRLVPETDKAKEVMNQYGLSFVNANGSFKSFSEIAGILKTQLGGLTAVQRSSAMQTIFGADAIRAAAVFSEAGAEGFAKYAAATRDKNAAEKLAQARTEGLEGAIRQLSNTFERVSINLSQGGLLTSLTTLANTASQFVEKLTGLPQWAKNLGVGMAAAAVAVPPLALGLSTIVTAGPAILTALGAVTAFLTGPWGIAIAAGVGLVIAFKDQIIAGWKGVKEWFARWVQDNQVFITGLQNAWSGFVAALSPLWEAIKTAISEVANTILSAFGTDTSKLFGKFSADARLGLTVLTVGAQLLLLKLTDFVKWCTAEIPRLVSIFKVTFAAVQVVVSESIEGFNGFLTFIWNLPGQVSEALSNLWQTIKTAWSAIDWGELGRAVVDGIVNGIKSRASAAADTARTLGSTIITAAKVVLDSHSPSRVFHGIGQDVGDGFVNGIASKFGDAKIAVGKLVGAGSDSGFTNSFLSSFTRNLTGDAGKKRFEEFTKSIKDGALQVQSAWTSSMNHIGSAIDEFVKTGKLNFSDLVRSMIADLASSALKNAFNGLLQGIMGITGGGSTMGTGSLTGGGGNWLSSLGSIFGGLFGGMASFEGGGYTGDGSRSGGLDGRGGRLAMIHPRETVIDHAAVKRAADRGRSQRPIISTPVEINLMPGVSKEELAQILPMLKRDILDTIPAMISRGGRYASAFGQ